MTNETQEENEGHVFCNQIYQYILSVKRTVFLDAYDLYVLEIYDYVYDACYACANF